MGIDSLGHTKGVAKSLPQAERKESAVPKAVEGAEASRVELATKRYDKVLKDAQKEITVADEARIEAIRRQVADGEYKLDHAEIARSIMQDRAFFAGLVSDEG